MNSANQILLKTIDVKHFALKVSHIILHFLQDRVNRSGVILVHSGTTIMKVQCTMHEGKMVFILCTMQDGAKTLHSIYFVQEDKGDYYALQYWVHCTVGWQG